MRFREAAGFAGLPVSEGKAALRPTYRRQVSVRNGTVITHSVDLDEHFRLDEPHASRWDYGLGIRGRGEFAVWVEPHSAASAREVDVVLRKLKWLNTKLNTATFEGLSELTDAARAKGICPFYWIHDGEMHMRTGGKEARLLALHGMSLPRRHIRIA